MRTMMALRSVPAVVLTVAFALPATADNLKDDMTWNDVSSKGASVVFGRLEGRFDSPEFRNRKIELHKAENGKEYTIPVSEGLGFFEAIMEPGMYQVTGIEATYYPTDRPATARYRPVRQRFGVPSSSDEAQMLRIHVIAGRPVYVGTIQIDNSPDGIVYRGHFIRVLDEFDETFERLETNYPSFVSSLATSQITPMRYFMLKPRRRESPLEIVELDDPIRRAREYISEYKFRQAINWLLTFMPASDRERNEMRLLIGEAYLGEGNFPEAIAKLGDALERDPENLRALRLLARAHLFHGDTEDALNLYGALAESVPGDAEAHLQLGYLYALHADSARSSGQFDAAFKHTFDYLLYDITPFALAMKAVRDKDSLEYEPPRVIRQRVRPPSMQSRRGSETGGGLMLVIDHNGKVVAARVTPGSTGNLPLMMISMINATFKPAVLNGVPVPSLLMMGGGPAGYQSQ